MTIAVASLKPWQRFVSRFLPWYDPDAQEERMRHTDELVRKVGRIQSIRISYGDAGKRFTGPERRRFPR
jgi:hypothetical protein